MEIIFMFVLALSAFMFLGFWGGLFALLALFTVVAIMKG